jgi:hypothetical protein
MNIQAVIDKAQDMYVNDNVNIPEHCGVLEVNDGYWVEVCVWVPKCPDTETNNSAAKKIK